MSGSLFIVCAPSGGGKTSIVNAVLAQDPALRLSISYTTRPPRPGEKHGVHYQFVDLAEFARLQDAGAFLEHALVHGNRYGTSRPWLEEQMAQDTDVLLEIDVQGAEQVRRLLPESVAIFILPPSLELLRERLVGRGQDAADVIARRMDAAKREMQRAPEFDYVIINNDFSTAVEDFKAVIRAQRLRTSRQRTRHAGLFRSLLELD